LGAIGECGSLDHGSFAGRMPAAAGGLRSPSGSPYWRSRRLARRADRSVQRTDPPPLLRAATDRVSDVLAHRCPACRPGWKEWRAATHGVAGERWPAALIPTP